MFSSIYFDAFVEKTQFFFMLLYRKHNLKQTSSHCISITVFNFELILLLQFLAKFTSVCSKLFMMTVRSFSINENLKMEIFSLEKLKTKNIFLLFLLPIYPVMNNLAEY